VSNADVIRAFVDAWNRCDFAAVYALMADDIVYHNVPWEPLHGIDAVRSAVTSFGIDACEWTLHHIAESGPVVLTERTDRVRMGGNWVTIRIMGAFELENGRIRAWRDYFDPADLTRAR